MSCGNKFIPPVISYLDLFKRCPKDQVKHLKALHNKHRQYLKRLEKLPERLPAINWDEYRKNVREEDICVVCDFEERYKILEAQIPYPIDVAENIERIDCIKKEYKYEVSDFNEASTNRILLLEAEKQRIADMTPFEDMTLEDFKEHWPDRAIDPIKKPTFWPHTPEEQGFTPVPKISEVLKKKANSLFKK
ncbi:hypothetical protein ACFFRR_004489 [Megaselia abdita]